MTHPGEDTAEVISDEGRLTLLATATDGSEFVNLGGLKGNSGNQTYEVPAGTDTQKYDSVLIRRRAFSVGFAAAPLKAG
ncbi:MAG: DM13 domain-containing protein [Actinomycetota bacterium]|nr:DM13 domain-containing protein [Actinomycetota bacterium]